MADVDEMTPDEMERLHRIAAEEDADCECSGTCMVCIAAKAARVALKVLAKLPADASPSEPQEQEKRPDAFDWWWNYARPFPESTTDGDMARAAWVAGRAALIAEMDKIHAGIKEAENCDDK